MGIIIALNIPLNFLTTLIPNIKAIMNKQVDANCVNNNGVINDKFIVSPIDKSCHRLLNSFPKYF